MVVYSSNKIFFERDEIEYLNKVKFNEEAFNKNNIKSVNVSINDIDFYYSLVPTTLIPNINRFGFISYENLRETDERVLYVKLKDLNKKLNKKRITEEELAYAKYSINNIKKYLAKKELYNEYYDIFFPKDNNVLRLKEN